jgi:hypothetical protein
MIPALIYTQDAISGLPLLPLQVGARRVQLLVVGGRLMELRVLDCGNSAFLGERVLPSATLYPAPANPVLLFLHQLEPLLSREKVPFQDLPTLLSHPLAQVLLPTHRFEDHFSAVCNVKLISGEKYYQPSWDKLISYLLKLHAKARDYIMRQAAVLFQGESVT